MRKKIFIFLSIIAFDAQLTRAQLAKPGTFDTSLQELTDALAAKLNNYTSSNPSSKIAVWDLTDLNGGVSPIGQYIAEDVSINLSEKFHVANRNLLSTLIKENKLMSEGFINQATLAQVKKLSNANILIAGTISVLRQNIKVTLQALDDNGNVLAATKGDVYRNDDVNELLGVNTGSSNQGFNRSLNSNEQNNNPQTVSNDCADKHIGDYCFYNDSKETLNIYVKYWYLPQGYSTYYRTDANLILKPGESKCLTGLLALTRSDLQNEFTATRVMGPNQNGLNVGINFFSSVDQGYFRVVQCKSTTYKIK